MSWDITLPNYPQISQLARVTTDGRYDENYSLNCGPSTVAGVCQYTTGVLFLPDEVHDIIWAIEGRKSETTGVTNEVDLQRFLSERCSIHSTVHTVGNKGESMAVIRSYLFQNLPVIVLRSFTAPGSNDGHWCTVIGGNGIDANHTSQLYTTNPWGGYLMTESNDTFWSWQYPNYPTAGVSLLIGIDRPRDSNL